jgi:hypothetical protein
MKHHSIRADILDFPTDWKREYTHAAKQVEKLTRAVKVLWVLLGVLSAAEIFTVALAVMK